MLLHSLLFDSLHGQLHGIIDGCFFRFAFRRRVDSVVVVVVVVFVVGGDDASASKVERELESQASIALRLLGRCLQRTSARSLRLAQPHIVRVEVRLLVIDDARALLRRSIKDQQLLLVRLCNKKTPETSGACESIKTAIQQTSVAACCTTRTHDTCSFLVVGELSACRTVEPLAAKQTEVAGLLLADDASASDAVRHERMQRCLTLYTPVCRCQQSKRINKIESSESTRRGETNLTRRAGSNDQFRHITQRTDTLSTSSVSFLLILVVIVVLVGLSKVFVLLLVLLLLLLLCWLIFRLALRRRIFPVRNGTGRQRRTREILETRLRILLSSRLQSLSESTHGVSVAQNFLRNRVNTLRTTHESKSNFDTVTIRVPSGNC
jgi:hypothetical protein